MTCEGRFLLLPYMDGTVRKVEVYDKQGRPPRVIARGFSRFDDAARYCHRLLEPSKGRYLPQHKREALENAEPDIWSSRSEP